MSNSIQKIIDGEKAQEAFFDAVRNEAYEAVKFFLSIGVNINCKDIENRSVLCYTKSLKMMKLLLDNNIKIKNFTGFETFLNLAVHNNDFELVKLLLEKGMDVNVIDLNKHTPLYFSIHTTTHASIEMMKFLLDKGADPNIQNYIGYTVLMYCLYENIGEEKIKLLLARGARIDLKNIHGKTALDIAKEYSPNCVDFLQST